MSNDGKLNHIDFMKLLIKTFNDAKISASFTYPEENFSVTLEIIERSPSELSSNILGRSHRINRPIQIKEEYNIVENESEIKKLTLMDNKLRITIFDQNVINAEEIAEKIEKIININYNYYRKYIDNIVYQGRLISGFSSSYNNRKMYIIPLIYTFRTSEISYESNPVVREIEARVE